ncbi:unnamed protein product [Darwinula stevensoni]|uniref:Gustatory receptor n=1 Tax=Darwinula stevensoni TaxID=69355 RepID=A0A7R9FSZ5_9CRUS|nr:unnamed protein product [Darwinula stevensoni]CAG0903590.1 unnamed protein product [Darwinula stevensoni]
MRPKTLWEKFKPIAWLQCATGSLPLSGIVDAESPSHRIFSLPFCYCLLHFGLFSYMFFSHFSLNAEVAEAEVLAMDTSIFRAHTTRALFRFTQLYALFSQAYLLLFGKRLEKLFMMFTKLGPSGFGSMSLRIPLILELLGFATHVLAALLLGFPYYSSNPTRLIPQLMIALQCNCFTVMFLAFCLEIGSIVEAEATKLVETGFQSSSVKVLTWRYKEVRMLAEEISGVLCYPLLLTLLDSFLTIFSTLYFTIATLDDLGTQPPVLLIVGWASEFLYHVLRLIAITSGPQFVIFKVQKLHQALFLREEATPEVEKAVSLVHDYPIEFDLSGHFGLNRGILVTMLKASVAYMAILLQFDVPPH